jgi:hypothetical protein
VSAGPGPETDWNADRHIDAIAPLMGLEVTDEQRPGVRRFLEVARAMAADRAEAAPGDVLDLAPVFTPIPPKRMRGATDPLAWDAAAGDIAIAVAAGWVSAAEVIEATIARILRLDPLINAFTDRVFERAVARAGAIDAARAAGAPLGPLAGVPFAVKNLFAIKGW